MAWGQEVRETGKVNPWRHGRRGRRGGHRREN